MKPDPQAAALAERWQLALGAARRGLLGSRLGRTTGGALEYEDRRDWRLGDDVRRLDWRALARSGKLYVRLYREEVEPRVEIVLDGSASMALEPSKQQLQLDLAAFFARLAQRAGYAPVLVLAQAQPRIVPLEHFLREGLRCERGGGLEGVEALLRPGALRIVLSDALFAGDLGARVRQLATRAGALAWIQILGPWEAAPTAGEALHLEDAESGAALDLLLDQRVLARYQQRLERACRELEAACLRLGAPCCRLVAGPALEQLARGPLAAAQLIAPR